MGGPHGEGDGWSVITNTEMYFVNTPLQLALYYLDVANRIVLSTGHFDGGAQYEATWTSWAGRFVTTHALTSSGPDPETSLAVVPGNGIDPGPCVATARLYYLDRKSYVVERTGDGAVRRVGPRAMRGSKIAVAGVQGSDDAHVFYVAPDGELRWVRGRGGGRGWSSGMSDPSLTLTSRPIALTNSRTHTHTQHKPSSPTLPVPPAPSSTSPLRHGPLPSRHGSSGSTSAASQPN